MKTFICCCGNTLHFENTRCLGCGRRVAFLPDALVVAALEPLVDQGFRALLPWQWDVRYRRCRNDTGYQVCNWVVRDDDTDAYCVSCRLNRVIPDLSSARNVQLWRRIEDAKRRLMYTVLRLGLPFVGRDHDAHGGLGFRFLADTDADSGFSFHIPPRGRVLTGHDDGLITINLAEADTVAREVMRERMNEEYRTLLGHFRHESGHYFWDRLVRDSARLADFRALFGDERVDYAAALSRYYDAGAPVEWRACWISAYAASHPWEDWAETWAHYLHMIDTLETAEDYGFTIHGEPVHCAGSPALAALARADDFERLFGDWVRLTTAMNAVSRSMGLTDAYPFALNPPAARKLGFVHALVRCAREPE